MSYSQSEKAGVENPCVKYARDIGCYKILKVNPLWAAGWQDRIFFVPGGKPLIIEFKKPGGTSSKLQAQRHKELLALGYDHHVIDSKVEGKNLIRARMESGRLHEEGDEVDRPKSGVRTAARPRVKKD